MAINERTHSHVLERSILNKIDYILSKKQFAKLTKELEMKKWDDVKDVSSSIPQDELRAVEFTAKLVAKIILRRKELGWTQAQLAEAAGLKQSAVARIESAKVIPRIDTIQTLAKAVGMKLDLVLDEQAAASSIA